MPKTRLYNLDRGVVYLNKEIALICKEEKKYYPTLYPQVEQQE